MIVNTLGLAGRGAAGNISNVDINRLRFLIAEYLQVHIRHVTDDAHLARDLGADWLDRLELIMLVEDIAGVEITDNEAAQIELVCDLIHYIDQTSSRSESSQRTQYTGCAMPRCWLTPTDLDGAAPRRC
jgi:acyl carrier protein